MVDRGIVLTGGGALLNGLEELIEARTGIEYDDGRRSNDSSCGWNRTLCGTDVRKTKRRRKNRPVYRKRAGENQLENKWKSWKDMWITLIYRNAENGYTVMVMLADQEEVTCVGVLSYIGEEEKLEAEGQHICASDVRRTIQN